MDGKTLNPLTCVSRRRGGFERRAVAASGGGPIRRRAQHGHQLGSALPGDGQRGAGPDGRSQAKGLRPGGRPCAVCCRHGLTSKPQDAEARGGADCGGRERAEGGAGAERRAVECGEVDAKAAGDGHRCWRASKTVPTVPIST
jgi:hypothetical protein